VLALAVSRLVAIGREPRPTTPLYIAALAALRDFNLPIFDRADAQRIENEIERDVAPRNFLVVHLDVRVARRACNDMGRLIVVVAVVRPVLGIGQDGTVFICPIRPCTRSARARGWQIIQTFSDAGISGAKGRNERPGFDQMLKHAQRHRFDVVMVWSIDRIGRSLIDLLGTIQHLEACGVDLYLDQQAIDTTTPSGKLMFQVTGAFAEFERAMIRQRIHAGLRRAVANGKTLGRPLNDPEALEKARQALGSGMGINKVARQVGLGNSTVARLKAEMAASA
jgi:DNA invertase Pin-like site-specific DNA recombinase